MAKRLEEAEVSKGRIRVTGELHHARLRRLAATRSPEVIRALRTDGVPVLKRRPFCLRPSAHAKWPW